MDNKELARQIINEWEWNEDDRDENLFQFINGAAKLIFANNALELRLFELAFEGKSPAEMRSTPDFPELGSYTDHALLTAVENLFKRVKDGLGVFIIREDGVVIKDNKPLKSLLSDFKLHPGFETIRESAQKAAKEAARTRSRTINVGEPEPNNTGGVQPLTDVFHQPRPVRTRYANPAAIQADVKPKQPPKTKPAQQSTPAATPPKATAGRTVYRPLTTSQFHPAANDTKTNYLARRASKTIENATEAIYQFEGWRYEPGKDQISLNHMIFRLSISAHNIVAAAIIQRTGIPAETIDSVRESLRASLPESLLNNALECFTQTIAVGPWRYDKREGTVSYEGKEINFKRQKLKKIMLVTLLDAAPAPITSEQMQVALYGESSEAKRKSLNILKISLEKFLDSQAPGSSQHICRNNQGFHILPVTGTPDLENLAHGEVIQVGPWSYDEQSQMIFHGGIAMNFGDVMYEGIKSAMLNFPAGVNPDTLVETLSKKGQTTSTEVLLRDLSTIQTKSLTRAPEIKTAPLYYSWAANKIVLNILPQDWDNNFKSRAGAIEIDELSVLRHHARVFLDGQPLQRLGPVGWKTLLFLIQNKGLFVTGLALGEHVYGADQYRKDPEKCRTDVGMRVRRLRDSFNKALAGSGDRFIRSHLTYGYAFCDGDDEYNDLLRHTQSRRPYSVSAAPVRA